MKVWNCMWAYKVWEEKVDDSIGDMEKLECGDVFVGSLFVCGGLWGGMKPLKRLIYHLHITWDETVNSILVFPMNAQSVNTVSYNSGSYMSWNGLDCHCTLLWMSFSSVSVIFSSETNHLLTHIIVYSDILPSLPTIWGNYF